MDDSNLFAELLSTWNTSDFGSSHDPAGLGLGARAPPVATLLVFASHCNQTRRCTRTHILHGICPLRQCYMPPGRGDMTFL